MNGELLLKYADAENLNLAAYVILCGPIGEMLLVHLRVNIEAEFIPMRKVRLIAGDQN